jgi:hypothetical protein
MEVMLVPLHLMPSIAAVYHLQPHGSSRLSWQWVQRAPPVLSKIETHAAHSDGPRLADFPVQVVERAAETAEMRSAESRVVAFI